MGIESLQLQYCARVTQSHRRGNGQFFTPRWVAEGMARWVLNCQPEEILDPACGFGVLLDACRKLGFKGRLTGFEVDGALMQSARPGYLGVDGEPDIDVRRLDFLTSPEQTIPCAIVNPPYNKFQQIGSSIKSAGALDWIARETGAPVSGFTNQYALFLCLVLARLRPGGRAAFIVPSEFFATCYGVQIKRYLMGNRRLRHLVLFDASERIFPEAATTACVLLFEGAPCSGFEVWHMSGKADAQRFAAVCSEQAGRAANAVASYDSISAEANWQNLGMASMYDDGCGLVPLSAYGAIKRGIATGANEFFVLRPSEAESLRLPISALQPCVASAKAIDSPVFDDAAWGLLHQADRPCYLFDGVAGLETDSAQRYLAHGESLGYHLRYLTSRRKPWFKLESRKPAPLLLPVFSRSGFPVVFNRSGVVNLTAFHGFYPKVEFAGLAPRIWQYFKSDDASRAIEAQQRSYGDGLKKLEPGDWAKVLVPDWR